MACLKVDFAVPGNHSKPQQPETRSISQVSWAGSKNSIKLDNFSAYCFRGWLSFWLPLPFHQAVFLGLAEKTMAYFVTKTPIDSTEI